MRHRKIPGKKHKGYKDPETQQAARNEKLSVKVSYFIPIIISSRDLATPILNERVSIKFTILCLDKFYSKTTR